MSVARIRLFVTATAFVGWLGWLGYLAAGKTNPLVVSRSQVMLATHCVVARVSIKPDTGVASRDVEVVEDLRPIGQPLTGTIRVSNLNDAELAGGGTYVDQKEYLLLLVNDSLSKSDWRLVIPPERRGRTEKAPPLPWAYRWDDPEVRKQFKAMIDRP